jgi:hypothetical protein
MKTTMITNLEYIQYVKDKILEEPFGDINILINDNIDFTINVLSIERFGNSVLKPDNIETYNMITYELFYEEDGDKYSFKSMTDINLIPIDVWIQNQRNTKLNSILN